MANFQKIQNIILLYFLDFCSERGILSKKNLEIILSLQQLESRSAQRADLDMIIARQIGILGRAVFLL